MRHNATEKQDRPPEAAAPGLLPVRMARAFFSRQLRLKRGAKGLSIVLEGQAGEHGDALPEALTPEAAQALQMRTDLAALLDAASGSRRTLRHLAALEHGLVHKDAGALFLFEVPVVKLRVILRQFDGLLAGTTPPGLSALRGRLLDAIAAQEAREREAAKRQPISSFLVDHKIEVGEACASDFDKASAAWQQATGSSAGT